MHARNTHTRRRLVVAALAAGAILAPAQAMTGAASAAPPTTPTRAIAAVSSPTCWATLNHTSAGQLVTHYYNGDGTKDGGQWSKHPVAPISFNGVVETPRTMTSVGREGEQFFDDAMLAVRDNGSLWKVVRTFGGGVETTQIYPSGWGGISHIIGSEVWDGQRRIYALSSSGALYRYRLTNDGAPRYDLTIAPSGWGNTKLLSWGLSGSSAHDSLLGVTTSGALMRYEVDRVTGAVTPVTLRSSGGWDQLKFLTTVNCQESSGALIVGVFENGDVRAYFEADPTDRSGDDIVASGRVGRGFLGLVSN